MDQPIPRGALEEEVAPLGGIWPGTDLEDILAAQVSSHCPWYVIVVPDLGGLQEGTRGVVAGEVIVVLVTDWRTLHNCDREEVIQSDEDIR